LAENRTTTISPTEPVDVPRWVSRGRIPGLDGLRAIAIVLVLLAHASNTTGFPASKSTIALFQNGAIGVDVFFVLSGFLITVLLSRELDRTNTVSLKKFYLRRVLRIIPAYAAFLLVVFDLTLLGLVPMHWYDWLGALTYTINWINSDIRSWEIGHIWSLSIEEHFYFIWPFLLLTFGAKRARITLCGYLVAVPILRLLARVFFREYSALVYTSTLMRMDSIAIGCILALLASEPWFRKRTQLSGKKLFGVSILAMLILIVSHLLQAYWPVYAIMLSTTIDAVAIATIIWLCVNHNDNLIGRLLDSRLMVAIGTLSYSFYLWQQLFLAPHGSSWIRSWPWNIGFALLAGVASYLLIESPFLRIKERIAIGHRQCLQGVTTYQVPQPVQSVLEGPNGQTPSNSDQVRLRLG
jgi:peptidoglycan/LPS O-acetylase OafA/YrhL